MDSTNLVQQVNKLREEMPKDDSYNIFEIVISELTKKPQKGLMGIHKNSIYLAIRDKIINIPSSEIESIERQDKKIILKRKDDLSLKFTLSGVDPDATSKLEIVLIKIKKGEALSTDELESIPELRDPSFFDQKSIYLFVTSLFMIVIGLAIQREFFLWAWFLIVSGLIVAFLGVIITLVKKRLI